jgi:hypothetical protein
MYATFIQRLALEGLQSTGAKKSKEIIEREYSIAEEIVTKEYSHKIKESSVINRCQNNQRPAEETA